MGGGLAAELGLGLMAGPLSLLQGAVGGALLVAEAQVVLALLREPSPALSARLHSLAPVLVLVATLAAHALLALLSPNPASPNSSLRA